MGSRNHKIEKVKSLAERLGNLFSMPGKSKHDVSPAADTYARGLKSMKARYNLAGMVARWEEHPFHGDDASWERDHQPHNDLIETTSRLPQSVTYLQRGYPDVYFRTISQESTSQR